MHGEEGVHSVKMGISKRKQMIANVRTESGDSMGEVWRSAARQCVSHGDWDVLMESGGHPATSICQGT